jgi:hypothetical protein
MAFLFGACHDCRAMPVVRSPCLSHTCMHEQSSRRRPCRRSRLRHQSPQAPSPVLSLSPAAYSLFFAYPAPVRPAGPYCLPADTRTPPTTLRPDLASLALFRAAPPPASLGFVVVVVTVGSRPKRVEPSGQLAEHCVETLGGDEEPAQTRLGSCF